MLTKKFVLEEFRREILPIVRREFEKNGIIDKPARAEAWNNFVDFLEKNGRIRRSQADNWTNPFYF